MISCGRGGGLAFQVMRRYNNMLSALAGREENGGGI